MCLENTLSNLLKQVFSPATRLWIVRELLPQNRYLEVAQDFEELSDGSPEAHEEQGAKQKHREQIQALLSRWVRTGQWHYFIPAIEIIFQIAHQENRQEALKALSKAWPEHLTLSEEGFIQYFAQPLLQYMSKSLNPHTKEALTTIVAPTEAENRKELFQRIRQKRLLLLKQWESL